MDLHCRPAMVGTTPTLWVNGELDLASIPVLHQAIVRLLTAAPPEAVVAVDLDGLTVLDDAGLGVLLGAAARARARGGDLVIVCTSPAMRQRFDLSGLSRAIEVRSTLTPR